MVQSVPFNQKIAKFNPTSIWFIFVQNEDFEQLATNPLFKHVKNLPSTNEDINGMMRLAKKLGS